MRLAASEYVNVLVETWPLARFVAVAVMVHAERVSEQSMMSPAAIEIGLPGAPSCWLAPSKRDICIFPKSGPVPSNRPLYPRSLPPAAWKYFIPIPTPELMESSAPNRCVQRIVQPSELVS